nr:hypothetical protein X990_5391 [Burkholderia pseudomallei MSHR4868]
MQAMPRADARRKFAAPPAPLSEIASTDPPAPRAIHARRHSASDDTLRLEATCSAVQLNRGSAPRRGRVWKEHRSRSANRPRDLNANAHVGAPRARRVRPRRVRGVSDRAARDMEAQLGFLRIPVAAARAIDADGRAGRRGRRERDGPVRIGRVRADQDRRRVALRDARLRHAARQAAFDIVRAARRCDIDDPAAGRFGLRAVRGRACATGERRHGADERAAGENLSRFHGRSKVSRSAKTHPDSMRFASVRCAAARRND